MADHGRGQIGGRGRDRGRGFGRDRGRGIRGRASRDAHVQDGIQHITADAAGEYNAHLTERLRGRRGRNGRDQYLSSDEAKYRPMANAEIARYVQTQEHICSQAEPNDWLSMPEIPPPSEICLPEGAAISLPRNKIEQPWTKNERYLKAHYKLLREDAISPLREAVERFRKDTRRMDDNETRIYEQVRVVGLTFTYKGIASRIRFSTARSGRKIQWSSSKRLTSGTLVALTPTHDEFKSKCILAVVAARPLQNLEGDVPEVDIIFGDVGDHEVDPQNTYIMIEATQGYYEAYRHTLRALQKQAKETFPLAEHICQLVTEIGPPDYVRLTPERDISPAADENTIDAFRNVDILNNWPSRPTSLDPSQWRAMQNILTKKLAIIQGPPGTGKTYVSKIAIDILLRNRSSQDPPIIVACQTNHALDQLLTFIRSYEPNFIRLGGRSTTAEIKQRALYEVRRGQVIDEPQGSCFFKARRDIATETMKLKSILSPVNEDLNGPITAEMMFHLGVIDAQQHQSLVSGASQWVRSDESTGEPLEMWLGKVMSPFVPTYAMDSFGFEEAEEDLELEQRKELDAELGVADEEDTEMLRGDFLSLSMGYTMPTPRVQTIAMAKRALDTSQDLYKVPDYLKGPIYLVMQEKAKMIVRQRLREAAKLYAKAATQIQIGRWEKDIVYLSKAPIIGMTTTGLSKYRALVSALKPKVILIEEAAEVLEAPVGVACVESLEHLILVGDHEQLQAHCSVRELEGEPYYLNISMFERLVRNGLPRQTLLRQRRMDPAFRELIQPIYPKLQDHESVLTRGTTEWGMGPVNHWFFKHDSHELQDESMSTFNEFEAQMIAKFYRHLIRNRVPAAAITVLTFYNGQRKKILKALKSDPETASIYNKVKTVDSYQGEENSIVMLSLVRSNHSGKIGFLDIKNRIVVALSRAKYGFYLFGHGDFLAEHNEIWDYVETHMHNKGLSDERLPLICTKHGNKVWIKHFNDFDDLDGGCRQPCGGQLTCGHNCPLRCHPSPHEWIHCARPCQKELECGHFCQKKCHEACGCECEAYLRYEEEARSIARIDRAPQRHDVAGEELRVENTPKIGNGSGQASGRGRVIDHEDDPVQLVQRNILTEVVREKAGGRVRYEHAYEAMSDAPTAVMSRLHIDASGAEARQSVKAGKQREIPTRQSEGPPKFGLDGVDERDEPIQQKCQSVESWLEAQSGPEWDREPATTKDVFSDWFEPEEQQWEAQQRTEIKQMGTECW